MRYEILNTTSKTQEENKIKSSILANINELIEKLENWSSE